MSQCHEARGGNHLASFNNEKKHTTNRHCDHRKRLTNGGWRLSETIREGSWSTYTQPLYEVSSSWRHLLLRGAPLHWAVVCLRWGARWGQWLRGPAINGIQTAASGKRTDQLDYRTVCMAQATSSTHTHTYTEYTINNSTKKRVHNNPAGWDARDGCCCLLKRCLVCVFLLKMRRCFCFCPASVVL